MLYTTSLYLLGQPWHYWQAAFSVLSVVQARAVFVATETTSDRVRVGKLR
jgi:hypothetical protein